MTSLSLGGPGLGCSAMRVRRLLAGELGEAERQRAEEHLAACGRCQATRAEIEEEGRALARALPFERFAAGVAEKAARREPRRLGRVAWVPALAAGLALAAALPIVARLSGPGSDEPFRTKGAASLQLFVQAAGEARALAPGEPVPAGARLRAALSPGSWRFAALALADADGPAVLYAGPARPGPLPEAFEWTGGGAEGTLWLVLADRPVDGKALEARLRSGSGPAPEGHSEVLRIPLRRQGGP